jgi:hypothetical protein
MAKVSGGCDKQRCLYCRKEVDLGGWHSCWDDCHCHAHHYKALKCDCGRKNWIKVEFDGSGHDWTLRTELPPLEAMVKKVRER